ncbi:MAG TPA: hypothetical protein VK485_08640 [Sphingomicrobium sp.]|nr:hypothetical protein [Sphingomicrobium sp.]
MGAPDTGMQAAEQPAAETLLTAFKTITAAERRKHASVLNYWLSIRGGKEFPPLHDFDPLEISDFGQSSVLIEIMGSGNDAEIRHLGDALKAEGTVERIIDAPNPSVLSSIARKLPIVEISRDFLAFEEDFSTTSGSTRCWVTLLPLSSSGAWVDYIYAFVSVETAAAAEAGEVPLEDDAEDLRVEEVEELTELASDDLEAATVPAEVEQPDELSEEVVLEEVVSEEEGEPAEADAPVEMFQAEDDQQPEEFVDVAVTKAGAGFAKLFEGFAGLTSFYDQGAKVEPAMPPPATEPPAVEPVDFEQPDIEPLAIEPEPIEQPAIEQQTDEPAEKPAPGLEGILQSKLAEVRAMADEARAAKVRANTALYEGLGAAYDFALDAEDSPEEYLRLVEAQGLKIQLRSPMAPVAKLVFDGLCDDSVMAPLEAVLAWALKQELPRGSLAARIHDAGGIAGILSGESQPA